MKMQVVRLVTAVTLAMAALFALSLTLTPVAAPAHAAPEAPSAPITVTFWHPHAPPRDTDIQVLIDEFNATNGLGITVIGTYAGNYGAIEDAVTDGLQGHGPVPNLAVAYPNAVAEFARYGAVHFLDGYLAGVDTTDIFTDVLTYYLLPEYGDQTGGLQYGRSLEAMFYNTHLLTTTGTPTPTTWPEFGAACQAMASGAGVLGTIPGTDASKFSTWLWSWGGELVSADANHARFAEQPGIEAMRVFRDLINLEIATYSSDPYGPFTDGQVAFIQGSSSAIPYIESAMADGAGHEWGVTRMPAMPGEEVVNSYGGGAAILNHGEAADLASWEFLWWLVQPDQTARWAARTGYFPVAISADTHPSITAKLASEVHYAQAFDLQPLGRGEPPLRGWVPIRGLLWAAIRDILYSGDEITATLQAAAARADQILAETGPESVEITSAGGTLILGNSGINTTTVSFPAGAVSISTTFSIIPLPDTSASGLAFALVPETTFSTSVTIDVTYTDTDVVGMDEDALKLWFFDWGANTWTDADPCGGYVRLPGQNTLSAGVCHFSDYALMDRGRFVYLPLVIRN